MTLEISPSLPLEIIREILLKGTVKPLLRCKSVCKHWYALISDQNFIKTHYYLSSCTNNINYGHRTLVLYKTWEEPNNLIICPLNDVFDKSADNNSSEIQNPLQPKQSLGFRIVGSCHGLMCLFVDGHLFLCNPSTRVWNRLPFQRINSQPECFSFGYVQSTDDFKIVEISTTKIVNIYSLKTDMWKTLAESTHDFSYRYPLNAGGIFSNGALHWLVSGVSPQTNKILSLDLANETFGQVSLPDYYDDDADMDLRLGVFRECLCVLCEYMGVRTDLWVMNVYGLKDSWIKLDSFRYAPNGWVGQYPVPLFMTNDGKVLFQCYMGFVIYDSKDTSVSRIHHSRYGEACILVESLMSPFPPLGFADNNDDEN